MFFKRPSADMLPSSAAPPLDAAFPSDISPAYAHPPPLRRRSPVAFALTALGAGPLAYRHAAADDFGQVVSLQLLPGEVWSADRRGRRRRRLARLMLTGDFGTRLRYTMPPSSSQSYCWRPPAQPSPYYAGSRDQGAASPHRRQVVAMPDGSYRAISFSQRRFSCLCFVAAARLRRFMPRCLRYCGRRPPKSEADKRRHVIYAEPSRLAAMRLWPAFAQAFLD